MPNFQKYGYQCVETLGSNPYAGRATYKAVTLTQKTTVVIKQFSFANNAQWKAFDEIEKEMAVLKSLEHPGIPGYLGQFQTQNGICFVQEYVDAPTLAQLGQISPEETQKVVLSVLNILVYLQGIMVAKRQKGKNNSESF